MKNFIPILITLISFCANNASAQTSDNLQVKVDSLQTELVTIKHNLEYLNLTYELNILNADINISTNDAKNNYLLMQIELHQYGGDMDMYHANRKLYDSYITILS